MKFAALRNPTRQQIDATIAASKHKAARQIVDAASGDVWIWPFEMATHREAADHIGINYSLPPGQGDVLIKE